MVKFVLIKHVSTCHKLIDLLNVEKAVWGEHIMSWAPSTKGHNN